MSYLLCFASISRGRRIDSCGRNAFNWPEEDSRKSPLPSGILPVKKENDTALDPERCTLCRQAVGVLLYMQADEPASQFANRLLSTCVSLLRHLVGYLTFTNGHCICLEAKGIGQGIKVQTPGVNVIEGYSDSDWAGDRKSRKSVSAAAILANGHFIYGASRTQIVISLSSGVAPKLNSTQL